MHVQLISFLFSDIQANEHLSNVQPTKDQYVFIASQAVTSNAALLKLLETK